MARTSKQYCACVLIGCRMAYEVRLAWTFLRSCLLGFYRISLHLKVTKNDIIGLVL